MRVFAAAMAAALAATMAWSGAEAVDVQIDGFPFVCKSPEGEFLKPKFGDVDGVYFTNLPAGRKPCLETIDRMVYSCTANTTFISHDLNNQYPDCLPIFERQAEQCVRHFEQERQKCYAGESSAPEQPAAEIASSSSDDAGDTEIKGFSFGCTTPDGETRKPSHGGVDGKLFGDLPAEREACLSFLSLKMSACRKNVSFYDHRQNRKFAACLPIFKEQVQDCVRHFEQERQKCYAGDSSAPAAITAEPEEPEAEAAHLTMWAMKRSNIRGGPGTNHAKVGLLEIGDEVQVTGEIGDWLRIEAPGGGDAFVYAPLLTDDAPSRPSARTGTETARALDIPDKATRDRVADWMDRCTALWRSELMAHISPHDSVVKQEKELLDVIEFGYRAAETAKRYLDECIAVSKRVRDSGRPCGEMGRKTQEMTGYRTRVLREARHYLENDGLSDDAQQRTVEEYLQTCVTAYATVLDGRHLKPYRPEDDMADVATTASGSSASVDTGRVSAESEASSARIPDKATRERVAGWLSECRDLWGELVPLGASHTTFSNDREIQEFLTFFEENHPSHATKIRQYLRTCKPVGETVRESGRPCRELAMEVHMNVGLTDEVTDPDSYFNRYRYGQLDDSLKRTVDEYLQTCVTAYATVLDGRHLKPYRPEGDIADAATTASGSSASVDTRKVPVEGEASPARIPVDAAHCVRLHETGGEFERETYADGTVAYQFEWLRRYYENTCKEPIVLRVRYFSKWNPDRGEGYVIDRILPGHYKPDTYDSGANIIIDNHGITPSGPYSPLSEIAYCAEFVDTDITPEYLYNERYRLHEGSGFGSYSGVVDHLRGQGIKVGPEMRAYYDAYFDSLEHSPCYAEVVREPPIEYEYFPPLDWYEVSRMSLFVTFHTQGGGFEALSFDETADFGGVSFHDVGGTDTHYISDLPKPSVGRN